jgi:hypothetical protein
MRRRPVFIIVVRDTSGSVAVRLSEPDAFTQIHIDVSADISAGEESRALFESGAAVQRAGADYLISLDWLVRLASAQVADIAEWESRLLDLVSAGPARTGYVASVDAIRARTVRPA